MAGYVRCTSSTGVPRDAFWRVHPALRVNDCETVLREVPVRPETGGIAVHGEIEPCAPAHGFTHPDAPGFEGFVPSHAQAQLDEARPAPIAPSHLSDRRRVGVTTPGALCTRVSSDAEAPG